MSKLQNTKKNNLKMKRQIRKTVGALFMVSAIVVAAIPVQDIEAEELKAESVISDTRAQLNYNPTESDDITYAEQEYLSKASDPTTPIKKSYYVRDMGGGKWELNWQFEYYIVSINESERAIVSGYNNSYAEKEVILSSYANDDYYIVDKTDYESFYATGDGAKTYTFAYSDYVDWRASGAGAPTEVMEWIERYRKEAYDGFMEVCELYYEYKMLYQQWEVDHAAWESLTDKTGHPEPQAPSAPAVAEPTQLSYAPASFPESEKFEYYCDCNSDISAKGDFTLVKVRNAVGDSRPEELLLVKTEEPNGNTDNLGFLVNGTSKTVFGIGDRAFQGIGNVDTLVLPEQLKYIGEEAFMDSFIKSINLNNVENVGNRAFKNCRVLESVQMSYTRVIGAESFYHTAITELTFPALLSRVGYGAFADCGSLEKVDFENVTANCTIDPYAFFNDYALNSVSMSGAGIVSIGEGAFAVISSPTGGWTNVTLPRQITGVASDNSILGDLLFAGRANLNTVKFPDNYGTSTAINIPSGMFKGCAGLECVDFTASTGSTISGLAGYDVTDPGGEASYNYLFLDVTNPKFLVKGPELNVRGGTAYPRKSTWDAFTRVSNFVPYNYKNSEGLDCYEVSDGKYLLQANEKGELTSCELIDKISTDPIDLTIPSMVGNYKVETITNGCFSEERLRNRIRSITISDDSLIRLDDSVFEGLPNLEWVEIGNSVQSIGKRAFANCPKLIDVTFHTPLIGYSNFAIGDEAFKTNSNELTFHGDIVKGYAPFDFATGKESSKIDDEGKRICYKSLSPDLLTVMYDNKSGEVTLLDYPKYNELDIRQSKHCEDMEEYYYKKYGGDQEAYSPERKAFTKLWIDSNGVPSVYNDASYGPWIDKTYLELLAEGYFTEGASVPLTMPEKYYDRKPYSILENYERGSNATMEFQTVTDEELAWINTCLNIVVPQGVTSIDASAFFNATENTRNVATYFGSEDEGYKSYQMCTASTDDAVPGLFSGYYPDYDEEADKAEYEKAVKGNDRILSISMVDVKELPDYAFDSCERLQSVTLGDALAQMGEAPFRGCSSLENVSENKFFKPSNRIIYSVNDDGTYTIVECLSSRGGAGSDKVIMTETDPQLANVSAIRDGAFDNCDEITRVSLDDAKQLKVIPERCFFDCDKLKSVSLPTSVNRISSEAFSADLLNPNANDSVEVTIPGKEVHIVSDAFLHPSNNTIWTYKGTSAEDYGLYYKNQGIDVQYLTDTFTVEFIDSISGERIGEIQSVPKNTTAEAPADSEIPKHDGYTFTGWSKDFSRVQENLIVLAQYINNSLVPSSSPGQGGNTNPSASPSASPSAKPSASPSASPSANPEDSIKKYTVSVSGGSGSGSYAAGAIVAIRAYASSPEQVFDKWTTSTAGVGFADATALSTTFTMPAANVAITATYKVGNSNTAANGTGNTNGSNNTSSNSGTSVQVSKPGFSNTNLAGATVSGSTDNFIVKVTEDQAATDAVIAALQAKYGDISRIKYLPMDISLYDSTGRTKIADTSGITVNLTLPLPDDLAQYAGNNKVAAVANGTLEDLNARFTTVDGVPCVNFTATHFSPYVIYVDTANLTEGTIDATPKTGDPIHPKWFLALGLACISMILFFKKDKAVAKTKTA